LPGLNLVFFLHELGGSSLWSLDRAERIREFDAQPISNARALTPDGERVLTGSLVEPAWVEVWNVRTSQDEDPLDHGARLHSFAACAGDRLVSTTSDGIHVWNLRARERVRAGLAAIPLDACLSVSPSGRYLLVEGTSPSLQLWDLEKKSLVRGFPEVVRPRSIAFCPDEPSRFLVVDANATVYVGDIGTPGELARLLHFADGEWAVVTPTGQFDASNLMALPGFAWRFDDDALCLLPPELYARILFEPQVFARENDPSLRATLTRPGAKSLYSMNRAQPQVGGETGSLEVSGEQDGCVTITVPVSGGTRDVVRDGVSRQETTAAYDLRIFRDGQLVDEPAPPGKEVGLIAEAGRSVVIQSKPIRLPRQPDRREVEFTAYCFNADRVRSNVARTAYRVPDDVRSSVRRAYLITFGVDVFRNPDWNLRFAASDALAMGRWFRASLAGGGQFAEANIVWVPLVSEDRPAGDRAPARTANRLDLEAVLQLLAGRPWQDLEPEARQSLEPTGARQLLRATPDDLVLVLLSSHGYTDEGGTFYLLPSDIPPDLERTGIQQPKGLKLLLSRCISSEDLARWLQPVDAGELVLLIDACQSAGSVAPPGYKHGPFGSRGLGQLAYDKAMRVLAASQFDRMTFEPRRLGHGLLTYALVEEGLRQGLAAEGGPLTLGRWLRYGEQRIGDLESEIWRQVRPQKTGAMDNQEILERPLDLGGRPVVIRLTAAELQVFNGLRRPVRFDFAPPGRDTRLSAER
jgi:hypothetical protein